MYASSSGPMARGKLRVEATGDRTPPDELAEMLADPQLRFTLAPENVMKFVRVQGENRRRQDDARLVERPVFSRGSFASGELTFAAARP